MNQAGDVVADDDEHDSLLSSIEANGPRPDLVVQRIPEANAPLFVGLG